MEFCKLSFQRFLWSDFFPLSVHLKVAPTAKRPLDVSLWSVWVPHTFHAEPVTSSGGDVTRVTEETRQPVIGGGDAAATRSDSTDSSGYLSRRKTSLGKEKIETWGEILHLQSLAHGLYRSVSPLPVGRNRAGLKKFSSELVEVRLHTLPITFLPFLPSRMGQPRLPAWPGPQIMPNLPFAQWIAWFSYMMNRVSVGTSFPPSLQMLR